MLAKRIIPCLDVDNGRVVKGINFVNIKDAGNPVELAKFYNSEGADELVLLDITASFENRSIMLDIVHEVAKQIFIPFTVGGGIKSINDIKNILLAGADKVSINTQAVNNPKLITEAAKTFGSQCIVLAIDAKKIDNSWEVFVNGGRTSTNLDALDWAEKAAKAGAGEILLTSMDRDGTQNGYDNELVEKISSVVNIPVIASGGAGTMKDFLEVFTEGKADAALAASLFHSRKLEIRNLKKYLRSKKIAIRN
ncbi:imidazole glycerol phosphate synthase subunit HisF [Candidatus Daviesbacteria bacterium]|nr:imidazole glycerol phosphate synthase subunit HisF [Candidatus Daviesbacteria bacterium]